MGMTPEYAAKYNPGYHAKRQQDPEFRAHKRRMAQEHRFRTVYGITLEERDAMYEKQGGVCAVCDTFISLASEPRKHRAQVDHDHETGKVRGLLCSQCNNAEGLLKGNPEIMRKLADYVERGRE